MKSFWFHNGGFIPKGENELPPSKNAIEVSAEYHAYLGNEQAKGNKVVIPSDGGVPYIEKRSEDIQKNIEKSNIITQRNVKLNKTDWTQLPDIPEEKRKKYAEYRQKLRDIPQQEGFPDNVQWPIEPE